MYVCVLFGYFLLQHPPLRLSPWGRAEERAQPDRVPSIHIARKVLNGRRLPSPPAVPGWVQEATLLFLEEGTVFCWVSQHLLNSKQTR